MGNVPLALEAGFDEGIEKPGEHDMQQRFLARLLLLVGVALVPAASAFAQPPAAAPPAVSPLVSEIPCPDPFVFNDGMDWYIYGSGHHPAFLEGHELGVGKMDRHHLHLDYSGFPYDVEQVWGFIVHRDPGGQYHAYCTLNLGHYRTVVAAFEPAAGERWEPGKPVRHWRFRSVLVGNPEKEDWNYYESKILEDRDGTNYLMYVGSLETDNAIYAQRMKSWDKIDASSPPHVMLKPTGYRSEDRDGPGSMQLVEGGSVFHWRGRVGGGPRDKYILLYSVGDYHYDNYKLGMAFCDSLIPPKGQTYQTVKLPDPKNIWGDSDYVSERSGNHNSEIAYLLQSEQPDWPNYSANLVSGPGLGSIVPIADHRWLFFHGYKPDDTDHDPKNRFVFRLPLTIAITAGPPTMKWLHVDLPRGVSSASPH